MTENRFRRHPLKDEASASRDEKEVTDQIPPGGALRLALVGGIVAAAVLAAVLFMGTSDPELTQKPTLERGVVCPRLQEAFEYLQREEEVSFAEAVRTAARQAEMVLQRSGQLFGPPENLALRLRAGLNRDDDATRQELFAEAQTACESLSRWTPTVSTTAVS